jgi:hypothetical protein
LDWTPSAYIAAFFAYSEAIAADNPAWPAEVHDPSHLPCGNVDVWELTTTDEFLQLPEVRVVEPVGVASFRQRALQGLLTRLDNSIQLDVASYLESKGLGYLLHRYVLQLGEEVALALVDLRRMAIDHATLFPDLNGAAQQANLVPRMASLENHR